jgi:hypothetical protein
MAREVTPAAIEDAVRALVAAQRTNLGIEVTLPVAFGDGEPVSVVVETGKEAILVHDAGASAMRLTGAGIALSKHVVFRLGEFCHRYRCKFVEGRVLSAARPDDLALVVCLVANASRAVADYAYEIRRQAEADFRVVLLDRLKEIVGRRVRDADEVRGASGARYRVPIILDPSEARRQNFVAAVANRGGVARSVSMYYDIRGLYPDVERDSVFDSESDIRQEDRSLLRSVGSEVFALAEVAGRFGGVPEEVHG